MADLVLAVATTMASIGQLDHAGWLKAPPMSSCMGILVQLPGTVIAVFFARYLGGEPDQPCYMTALAGVLAVMHVLLLVDHWVILVVTWALVGIVL